MRAATNTLKQTSRKELAIDEQLGIPQDLAPVIRQTIRDSGLSYDSYAKAITANALKDLPYWSQSDLERLIITANAYRLNPLSREISMLKSHIDQPAIIVVGVDGWSKIMNAHAQFAGVQFLESGERSQDIPNWMECEIYRHDRVVPLRVREYFDEVRNDHPSWITHPRRMLRHKCMVQCARIAFGLSDIYDPDEALRVEQAIERKPPHKAQGINKTKKGIEALTQMLENKVNKKEA